MNHPSIIKFHDSFIENNKLNIIMDFARGGDLKAMVDTFQKAG